MKNGIHRWEDIDRQQCRRYVHQLQKDVRDAEIRGDKDTVTRQQQRIVESFHAKLLAVMQVAQFSRGRKTAGPDGIKSLTGAQMLKMAQELSIHHRPSPVRRKLIDKPGKKEKRPLGIPNLVDRAHQALIAMAMEPQWEAHFSNRQYGFRKGRGPHDAIGFLRSHLRKSRPKFVLDADIEKFFDRLDHEELLRRIDAPAFIAAAVRRIIKAGALADGELTVSDVGTPQGGPLSPLLANIALAGLEDHLIREFRRDFAGRITALGYPALAVYADDLVVLHKDRHVVEWSRTAIMSYLAPLGLKLSDSKTRIVHTLDTSPAAPQAGFDFLGFHLQHHWGSRKKPGGKRTLFISATPSKAAQKRFYDACADRIDKLKLSRKFRGARRDRQTAGKMDPVSLMILDLNRKIRGWGNYFRHGTATEAFSRIDHLLYKKLWQWALRRFKRNFRQWIIDHLFSGVELDREGKPLLRKDGTPRKRSWVFKSPFVPTDWQHVTLHKLTDISHRNHPLFRPGKSYYDGDWTYWQPRMKTRYPGTPGMICTTAFRRQKGKCLRCNGTIMPGERLSQSSEGKLTVIRHSQCPTSPPRAAEEIRLH
jgi:RNA-directed DNA polymerase